MVIDLVNEAYILQCGTSIPLNSDSITSSILKGEACFHIKFDHNINLGEIWLGIDPPTVSCSGTYTTTDAPKEPAFLFPYSCPDVPTMPGFNEVFFYDVSTVTLVSGITCSGYYFEGYKDIHSDLFLLVDTSYTILFNVNLYEYTDVYSQPNLFFCLEGVEGKFLSLGYSLIDGENELSIGLQEVSGNLSVYSTGLPFKPNEDNAISIRGDIGGKLRIGCNGNIIEINKPPNFLGTDVRMRIGGKASTGYCKGVVTDGLVWVTYVINDVVEYYINNPQKLFYSDVYIPHKIPTASGCLFQFDPTVYPRDIYLTTTYSGYYNINAIIADTYDQQVLLNSGIDNFFGGTVVRGLTSPTYALSVYNDSYVNSYGYIYAYDGTRAKALWVSSDGEEFTQNQTTVPGDVSWDLGAYNSGFTAGISSFGLVATDINVYNKISIYDSYRRSVYILANGSFVMVDLRSSLTYTLAVPTFITTTPTYDECVLVMGYKGQYVYCMCNSGLFKYNVLKDSWVGVKGLSSATFVALSTADHYVLFSGKTGSTSYVYLYNDEDDSVTLVDQFSAKVKVAVSDYIFIYLGRVIFRYDLNTLQPINASPYIGVDVSSVFCLIAANNYLLISTATRSYTVDYGDIEWGDDIAINNVACSWCAGYYTEYNVFLTYNISDIINFENVKYVKDVDNSVHVIKNYLNKVVLAADGSYTADDIGIGLVLYENVASFYIGSKYSINDKIVYGFSRVDTGGGIISSFMFYNPITDTYYPLSSINGGYIDVRYGVVVDTMNYVFYINFVQQDYYRYVKHTDTWETVLPPRCGPEITHCTQADGTYDWDNKIYLIGMSSSRTHHYNDDTDWQTHRCFYGYIDIALNKIIYVSSLRSIAPHGTAYDSWSNGGETCFINYNITLDKIFIGWSLYRSDSAYYVIEPITTVDACIFTTLEALYEFGCYSYFTMTYGITRDTMLNSYTYEDSKYWYLQNSDIASRTAIHPYWSNSKYHIWSFGENSNYTYSVNFRACIKDNGSSVETHFFSDVGNGYAGCAVGVFQEQIYLTTRSGTSDVYTIYVDLSTVGAGIDTWLDIGYSLRRETTVSGVMSLYVDGNLVGESYVPVNYSYGGSDVDFTYRTKSVLHGDNRTLYAPHYITELSYYKEVLTASGFEQISYTVQGKPLGPINLDSYIYSGYTHHQVSQTDQANLYQKYITADPVDTSLYLIGDRYIGRYSIEADSWADEVITNTDKPYTVASYTDSSYNKVVGVINSTSISSERARIVFDYHVDESITYSNTGTYVTKILDTGQDSMCFYNVEYQCLGDTSIDLYVRYAQYPPVDFVHLCYCDSSNYIREVSMATGRLFYKKSIAGKNSCAVYYNSDYYLVTVDGGVYKNGLYHEGVENSTSYAFHLYSFTLNAAEIISTWFSPDGVFILYYLTEKRLASFPLGLGFPCAVEAVPFTSVADVTWNVDSREFSVVTDTGVYVYNYKLGLVETRSELLYLFTTKTYKLKINSDGVVTYTTLDEKENKVLDIDDLDVYQRVIMDYSTQEYYYVSTYQGALKKFSIIEGEEVTSVVVGLGPTGVTKLHSASNYCVTVVIGGNLCIVNNNGTVVNEYPYLNFESGGAIYHRYNTKLKVLYYGLDYIYQNDTVWAATLNWVPMGSKKEGIVRGNRYVQFKAVLNASSDKKITPILERFYVGGPVRVGPVEAHSEHKFFVRIELPSDDSGDVFSTQVITYFERLFFNDG